MRLARCLALTMATLVIPSVATAATITSSAGFSINGTDSSQTITVLQPFDPALGNLESVFVGIQGSLNLNTSPVPQSPLLGGIFLPYAYTIKVTNDFFGLAGNLFDFQSDAQFLFSGVGKGEGLALSRAFTYGFTLTANTDLTKVVPVTYSGVDVPPTFAVATRAGFLPTVQDQYDLEGRFTASFLSGKPMPVTLSGGGVIDVTYTYSPAPAPVPEPSSLLLFGTGALGLLVKAWRRTKPDTRRAVGQSSA